MCTAVEELACLTSEDRDDERKVGKLRDRKAPRERKLGQTRVCRPDPQQAFLDPQHGPHFTCRGAGSRCSITAPMCTTARRRQPRACPPAAGCAQPGSRLLCTRSTLAAKAP